LPRYDDLRSIDLSAANRFFASCNCHSYRIILLSSPELAFGDQKTRDPSGVVAGDRSINLMVDIDGSNELVG
jgi:hypothetical protein